MDRTMSDAPARSRTPWRIHLLCYVLLSGLFAYVVVTRYLRPLVFEEAIGVQPGRIALVEQRIDPNTASWPELARLPGIGEVMAKRIVAFRDERLAARVAADPAIPVFTRLEELDPIPGIGPQTLARIAPHLKFPNTIPPGSD